MGRRGPAKTPPGTLKLRGSWRGNVSKEGLHAEMGKPPCPAWLRPEAKAKWATLIPQLDEMGILAKVDLDLVTEYCELWARWKIASLWIQDHGEYYQIRAEPTKKQKEAGEKGDVRCVQQWPQVSFIKSAQTHLSRSRALLGMTPPSRSGSTVGSQGKTKDKGKSRFFA